MPCPSVLPVAVVEWNAQDRSHLFGISTSSSARSARAVALASSRRSSTSLRSRSSSLGLAPRFLGVSAASSPFSAARRQLARCEEYKPSLRSRAPTSPGWVQAAASLTMRRRYSAVNRRRCGFDDTSVSFGMTISNMVLDPGLALDTKLRRADVSRHVGREG